MVSQCCWPSWSDKKSVRDYLKQTVEDLQNEKVVSIEPTPAAAPTKKTALDKLLGDEELESSAHEVDVYFSEKVVAWTTNPLLWWRDNTCNFPHIAQIVLVNTCDFHSIRKSIFQGRFDCKHAKKQSKTWKCKYYQ